MTTENQIPTAAPVTDIAALPPAERALIVLSSTKTELDLKTMVEEAKTITEVKDKAGREQAHRVGMRLKTARTTIEKTGKAAREDAQAFSKAVIEEEKRLKAITAAEEERIFKLRDDFDNEQRRIEEERERAAAARRAEIKGKIEGIRRLPLELAAAPSAEIDAEREALAAFVPTVEVFGEFTQECMQALVETVAALEDLFARTKRQEETEAALAEERERQAQAQREADERVAAERARAEAAEAELEKLRAQLAAAQAPAPAPEPAAPAGELSIAAAPFPMAETEPTFIGVDLASGPDVHVETEVTLPDADMLDVGMAPAPAPATAPTATDWRTRKAALAAADQFSAMAQKVQACGFGAFANDLLAVSGLLRNGDHDSAIAAADPLVLIAADNALLDATVMAVEALGEQQEAA